MDNNKNNNSDTKKINEINNIWDKWIDRINYKEIEITDKDVKQNE